MATTNTFVKPYDYSAARFNERVNRILNRSPSRVSRVYQPLASQASAGASYPNYTIPTNSGFVVAGRGSV